MWLLSEDDSQQFRTRFQILTQACIESVRTAHSFGELNTDQMWERACSRRRSVSRNQCRLLLRFREQARSHRGFVQDSAE
ncbi:hypothetical protein DM828_20535 [Pseudomonas umsongensis]|nr:hypothetical protein [Pseudomonas umsongensis]